MKDVAKSVKRQINESNTNSFDEKISKIFEIQSIFNDEQHNVDFIYSFPNDFKDINGEITSAIKLVVSTNVVQSNRYVLGRKQRKFETIEVSAPTTGDLLKKLYVIRTYGKLHVSKNIEDIMMIWLKYLPTSIKNDIEIKHMNFINQIKDIDESSEIKELVYDYFV
jgi:hypothetical protein